MKHGIFLAQGTLFKMADRFFELLPNIVVALLVFFLFSLLSKLCRKVVNGLASTTKLDATLAHAFSTLASLVVTVIGLLICATIVIPSFSPGQLIAGLGVTTVAVGFAFQNILQNFFAGMILLWQKPFRIGDEVKSKEFEGAVEDITIRTTILKTFTGERVYIPNGVLFTEPVTVYTAYGTRRTKVEIPLRELPAADARKAILDAVTRLGVADEHEPIAIVAPSGDTITLYFHAPAAELEMIKTRNQVAEAANQALSEVRKKLSAERKPQAA